MPKIVQNDFGAGEISPALYARTEDGSLLRSALRYLRNMLIQPGGWLTRRGGTRYVAGIKDSSKEATLLRYTVSGVGHYVVEASETAARFCRYNSSTNLPEQITSGGSAVELSSGWIYDEADMATLRAISDGEDLHITSGSYYPRTLTRTDDTTWAVAQDDYGENFPALEERGREITITPNSTAAGAFKQLSASDPLFPTDSGASGDIYYVNNGFFQINPLISTPQTALGTNLGDAPDSVDPTTDWTYFEKAGADTGVNITTAATAIGVEVTLTAASSLFTDAHVGWILDVDRGTPDTYLVLVTSVTNGTSATGYPIHTALPGASPGADSRWWEPDDPLGDITMSVSDPAVGTGVTLFSSSAYFTSDMIRTADNPGAFFGFLGGYCEVTAFTSSTQVTVEVLKAFSSAAPSAAWREGWSVDSGFPRSAFIHQSRLGFLDVDKKNQTFWLSKTNNFTNFLPVTNRDDSGISFDYKEANGNLIAAYSAGDLILVSEDVAGKITAVPITQSNFGIDTQARIGGGRVEPVLAGGELLFASRSLRRIYGMSYNDTNQRYLLPNRSFFGEHLIDADVKQMKLIREPQPVVYVLLTDGTLLAFCYDNQNQVQGFSRIDIGGDATVDAILDVPGPGRDDLWLIAKRTINGATARYIEVLDVDRFTDSHIYEETTFSALTVTTSSISGLSHLEGEEVQIRLDGAYRSNPAGGNTFTVTSGAIDISGLNLASTPTSVEVGLGFQYRMDISPAAFATNEGPSIGLDLKLGGARALVRNTLGLYDYNSSSDSYSLLSGVGRETGDPISSAPPLYTGWLEIPGNHGITDEADPVLSLAGNLPLPASILAVSMDVEAG